MRPIQIQHNTNNTQHNNTRSCSGAPIVAPTHAWLHDEKKQHHANMKVH